MLPEADYSRELLDAVPDLHAGDYPSWDDPSHDPDGRRVRSPVMSPIRPRPRQQGDRS